MEIALTYFITQFLPYSISKISLLIRGVVALELRLSKIIVCSTSEIIKKGQMKNMLSVICLSGPIIFLPNVWSAWTADDISSMSNPSWTIMIIVHVAVYIRLAHDGASSCTRISILIWMLEMILITLAILVR